ncbi:MAG: DUF2004 domain-containing protein [Lachnospiraceae bacterium]|nr:DUF2004 domain-containing protein [Lachnospiraceae bacterium]
MGTQYIELPIFGNVELTNSNDQDWDYKYETHLEGYDFGAIIIDIDVHIKELSDNYIGEVCQVLSNLQKVSEIATTAYISDYHNDGETCSYIQSWNEDIFEQIFSDEEFQAFLSYSDESLPIEERLLSLLRLVGIGIYAGEDEEFIVMDYAFGYDFEKGFRDDMLVIKLDKKYEVLEVTNEG